MTMGIVLLELVVLCLCGWYLLHIVSAVRSGVARTISGITMKRSVSPVEYWCTLAVDGFFLALFAAVGVFAYRVWAIEAGLW